MALESLNDGIFSEKTDVVTYATSHVLQFLSVYDQLCLNWTILPCAVVFWCNVLGGNFPGEIPLSWGRPLHSHKVPGERRQTGETFQCSLLYWCVSTLHSSWCPVSSIKPPCKRLGSTHPKISLYKSSGYSNGGKAHISCFGSCCDMQPVFLQHIIIVVGYLNFYWIILNCLRSASVHILFTCRKSGINHESIVAAGTTV